MNIDKKIIYVFVLCLIIYLIYQSSGLWISIFTIFKKICYPLLLSFFLAYAFYPLIKWLQKKGIKKGLSILIVVGLLLFILILFLFFLLPIFIKEGLFLVEDIITFLESISRKYNIDFKTLENLLLNNFNVILKNASIVTNIMNGVINLLSTILICFSIFIYLLIDMDEIRLSLSKFITKKNKSLYLLVLKMDNELKKYFVSFIKIMFITLIEYTLSFCLIGHPNFIILGFCAAIASFIPCFGGIIVNVVATITAFLISKGLFIRTIILFCFLSIIDSYIINPFVYGKTNNIKPLVSILALFIGSILFGVIGVIISMPCTIIIITIINYFKEVKHDTKT